MPPANETDQQSDQHPHKKSAAVATSGMPVMGSAIQTVEENVFNRSPNAGKNIYTASGADAHDSGLTDDLGN